nr:SDR family NAD(P)-dependent oxidoreductase [Streptomyces sp. TLI_235]
MQRVAVVSGGGTGIGKAVARELAVGGHRVAVIGRRAEVLERARDEIAEAVAGAVVVPVAADLTVPAQVASAAEAVAALGPVDVLVNNARDHHPARRRQPRRPRRGLAA